MSMFTKNREFIVDEKDVTTVLGVMNRHLRCYYSLQVGNCGWAGELANKWFIMFDSSDRQYNKIVKSLSEIGEFKLDIRPKGDVDLCFERKSN